MAHKVGMSYSKKTTSKKTGSKKTGAKKKMTYASGTKKKSGSKYKKGMSYS